MCGVWPLVTVSTFTPNPQKLGQDQGLLQSGNHGNRGLVLFHLTPAESQIVLLTLSVERIKRCSIRESKQELGGTYLSAGERTAPRWDVNTCRGLRLLIRAVFFVGAGGQQQPRRPPETGCAVSGGVVVGLGYKSNRKSCSSAVTDGFKEEVSEARRQRRNSRGAPLLSPVWSPTNHRRARLQQTEAAMFVGRG